MKNFEWGFCSWCGVMMIICPKCGNNTCNAGYGTLENGEKCNVCPEAYEYFKNNSAPSKPDGWQEQFKETHLKFKERFSGEITEQDIEWAEKLIKQRDDERTN